MPDIDTKLAAKLRQAMSATMRFAFIAKGNDGKLLVEKVKVPAKDITQAKQDVGGGNVFDGRCFGENGNLVFVSLKTPPESLAGLIKRTIKEDAGLTLNVETRED